MPGVPVPWKRPLNNAQGGRRTEPKDKRHRRMIALAAAGKGYAGSAAIHAHLRFYMPISPKASKAMRADMRNGVVRPCSLGDVDNLMKSVADALQGIAYLDDRQIVSAFIEKHYAEEPRTEIRLHRLE